MPKKQQRDPYAAQNKYVENQKKDGLVRVTTWVPPEQRDKLLGFAKKLRAE